MGVLDDKRNEEMRDFQAFNTRSRKAKDMLVLSRLESLQALNFYYCYKAHINSYDTLLTQNQRFLFGANSSESWSPCHMTRY